MTKAGRPGLAYAGPSLVCLVWGWLTPPYSTLRTAPPVCGGLDSKQSLLTVSTRLGGGSEGTWGFSFAWACLTVTSC